MHRTLALMLATGLVLAAAGAPAAPKPDLWRRWQEHAPSSRIRVDHSAWQRFLTEYVVADHPSGVNRVRYDEVSPADRAALDRYLDVLQAVPVSQLNRDEQRAYWVNLYNALTVKVVIDHYPVESIRDIDISPGFFSAGPWDAELLTIEGEDITLNNIEHRILRPIWEDNRIHYALNCASVGCPNLQPTAFTARNAEELLERAAREYVNHPRGARLTGGVLRLSSIYDWYQVDFEGSEEGVLRHLRRYAEPALAAALEAFRGTVEYGYDWALNE